VYKDSTFSSFSLNDGPEEIFTSLYTLPATTEADLLKKIETTESPLTKSKAYHSTHIDPHQRGYYGKMKDVQNRNREQYKPFKFKIDLDDPYGQPPTADQPARGFIPRLDLYGSTGTTLTLSSSPNFRTGVTF